MREIAKNRFNEWQLKILELSNKFGYSVTKLNGRQFLLEKGKKKIDIYMFSMRYNNRHLNQVGNIEDIGKFIEENFGKNC